MGIVADDLEKIGFDQIERAREAQVQRERQEKIRQRKLESKRVDHLARALREDEMDYLEEWASEIEEEDNAYLDAAESKNAEDQLRQHEVALKEKQVLSAYQKTKDKWADSQMEERHEKYQTAMEEREEKLVQQVVDR